MLKPTGLERVAVRAAFNRRRSPDRRADFLFREVERRMLERLDLIKLDPVARVLDVGCGLGRSLGMLAVRYPGAMMIGADHAELALSAAAGKPGSRAMVADRARRLLSGLGLGSAPAPAATLPLWLACDAHALAVAANTIDMVWSNLAAHWFDDPLAAVAEWHRVIRPDGLLMFSVFGVDTLKEMRPLPGPGKDACAWPAFQDMHDWGDALSAAGFADPVMDMERLTLTYVDPAKLRDDAALITMLSAQQPPATGGPCPEDSFIEAGSPRATGGAGALGSSRAADEPRSSHGSLGLTVELIYGHAWCPAVKRRQDGLATVQFHRAGASYNQKLR